MTVGGTEWGEAPTWLAVAHGAAGGHDHLRDVPWPSPGAPSQGVPRGLTHCCALGQWRGIDL